ncbi:hypothetical protein K437DRAFT_42654 [Tilletiaria anomala UBC 951]|uniref:Uncharacterized protein n=1 Tax=Tilletiaria anomala (strain ATCC 24038 / CBS 436.72 / UBC 951) TaxID=1037660 RepID=A0A066V649_TILAU|nr:uncharacterized protein K437DRAFT_42654 [Tilletiaria anomala UBC 951]KDN37227.1 hypothetical protein K437DRAFT_42654 [Tilletiaria anomala UBC 951]
MAVSTPGRAASSRVLKFCLVCAQELTAALSLQHNRSKARSRLRCSGDSVTLPTQGRSSEGDLFFESLLQESPSNSNLSLLGAFNMGMLCKDNCLPGILTKATFVASLGASGS